MFVGAHNKKQGITMSKSRTLLQTIWMLPQCQASRETITEPLLHIRRSATFYSSQDSIDVCFFRFQEWRTQLLWVVAQQQPHIRRLARSTLLSDRSVFLLVCLFVVLKKVLEKGRVRAVFLGGRVCFCRCAAGRVVDMCVERKARISSGQLPPIDLKKYTHICYS
jgi:hypothetical protein